MYRGTFASVASMSNQSMECVCVDGQEWKKLLETHVLQRSHFPKPKPDSYTSFLYSVALVAQCCAQCWCPSGGRYQVLGPISILHGLRVSGRVCAGISNLEDLLYFVNCCARRTGQAGSRFSRPLIDPSHTHTHMYSSFEI